MKFYVIADENTMTGFKLVGLEGEVVETADEAREALVKAFSSDDLGIVIITERIAASIREEMEEFREMVNSAVGVKV